MKWEDGEGREVKVDDYKPHDTITITISRAELSVLVMSVGDVATVGDCLSMDLQFESG